MSSGAIQITVRGGSSERPAVELQPGKPVEAFSIGTAASWKVAGPGVAPTHAYLYFDGTTLFVACAPGAIVQLSAGGTATTDWKPLAPPSEVRIGGVLLEVRAAGAADAHGPQTVRPGVKGGPQAAPQRPRPAGRPAAAARPAGPARPQQQPAPQPAQRQQPTHPAAPAQHVPPHAPPAAHGGVVGTLPYDDSEMPTAYQPMPEGFQQSPLEDFSTEDEGDTTRVIPQEDQPKPAARPERPERPAPPSVPPASDGATLVRPLEEFLAAQGSSPMHAIPQQQGPTAPLPAAGAPAAEARGGAHGVYVQPPEPTVPAMGPAGQQHPAMLQYGQLAPGQQPPPGWPGQTGPMPPAPGENLAFPDRVKLAWQQASPPRKALFFLMPLMILALIFHVALQAKRRAALADLPPDSSSQPSASGSALASASPSATAPATAATAPTTPSTAATALPTASASAEEPVKLAPGELTKQRQAVDAVARADIDKALQLYEELAKEHPDNPAYSTAVEILRKRKR